MDADHVRREAERRYLKEHHHQSRTVPSEDLIEELRIHQIELEIQNEELRRSQREAEEARERYFRLFEYAPVGYVTVRADGRILSANLRICELCDTDRRSLVRRGLFSMIDERDRPATMRLLKESSTSADECHGIDVRLAYGERRTVRVEAMRHDGEDRRAQEIQLTVTDITTQREAEERARAAADHNQLLLRELNHRVKNNLQLLVSLVMLQRDRSTETPVVQALSAVEERLRAVAFSHETLKPGVTHDGADLVELLRSITRQFEHYQLASVTLVSTIESLTVSGDVALSLALVTNELVSNSLKHATSDESGARVTVRLESASEDGGRLVRIQILDDGPGLPEAYVAPDDQASGHSAPGRQEGTVRVGRDGAHTGTGDQARGMGFSLVEQLIRHQLGGDWICRNHAEGGAEHVIEVNV